MAGMDNHPSKKSSMIEYPVAQIVNVAQCAKRLPALNTWQIEIHQQGVPRYWTLRDPGHTSKRGCQPSASRDFAVRGEESEHMMWR